MFLRRLGALCGLSLTALCSALSAGPGSAEKPDLTTQPTLYVVGYAHLDTEWRWEYPQVISEYLRKTMDDNFRLLDTYPHYVFNFSGANRYRLMKEYYPERFRKLKSFVDQGRWFPAGSSMEEGDVNAPSAESIFRQVLYGNNWFRKELGQASAEYMLPDCFGFPASLPTILAHSGVKGFSTQKLVWGSSADGGGTESLEKTPEGTPFNVGIWVGPDGESVLAGLNPGAYDGDINSDLTKVLPPSQPNIALESVRAQIKALREELQATEKAGTPFDPKKIQQFMSLRNQQQMLEKGDKDRQFDRFQDDWAARVENNGKITGIFADYHYFGTGDIGGAPREDSVKRLEAMLTKGEASFPPDGQGFIQMASGQQPQWPSVKVGDGPVHLVSARADQMFLDITPADAGRLPRYTGEMELTNHSAGSLTSQAYQKRWLRKEEVLADAAEKSSIAAQWLGALPYPLARLNDAWTLVMGGQFHDLAAGTATPKSYEFAWNDDVIALNQFAAVLNSSAQAVAGSLNTQAKGVPVVVFNPLNVDREEVVEADINFPGGAMPSNLHVTSPEGRDIPAQVSHGKVLFLAQVPSVGFAVYDVQAAESTGSTEPALLVTSNSLENEYYRVTVNDSGDVSAIFDKKLNKELLSSPARLAISFDNPRQWPAWNMDWDQEQAPPKAYVSGPAQIQVLENGPARVALSISRDTAGSHFVQVIRLSAGEAGRRVEFGNAIDWNTRESNLKAVFPLTASNRMATYNWDVGTIERPTAEPKKFEVPSHQWIDLTDMGGRFGATVLTDCKNGSDKPNDNTLRLTLLRTPGVKGGYPDQATQDLGHHEFFYGFAGHAGDWRQGQTDWQGEELNTPLLAFETSKHGGDLGRQLSLLKVSSSRVRVLALKKAEDSDEIILRLVEADGKPQNDVRVSFAAPIVSAREVNAQEQPLGPATVADGTLTASFSAYQPRTFAFHLAPASAHAEAVKSAPVPLQYDLRVASADGAKSDAGFDGKGGNYPAEMLPAQLTFNGVRFQLAPANQKNALVSQGQALRLPQGQYNRIYILAASSDGDQKAAFQVGDKTVNLNIENWGGFIGQWDNRQWTAKDEAIPARGMRPARTEHDDYAQMTAITPGFIKRADLAWYCSHHHNALGENVPYSYSYLFAYGIDLPVNAKSITLPRNDKVRILAISVAGQPLAATPVQPLYDTLEHTNVAAELAAR